MKAIVIVLAFFSALLQLPKVEAHSVAGNLEAFEASEVVITVHITGEIGRRSRDCKGLGLSCLKISFDYEINAMPVKGTSPLNISMPSTSTMRITFPLPETEPVIDDTFGVEDEMTIAPKLCKMLGYSKIKVLKGEYKCTSEKPGYGTTVVNVVTFK
jgi:hypothetical protein